MRVHQGILCKTSEFFKNVMRPEWARQKADPYTINLSDHTAADVKLYAQWLYSQKGNISTEKLSGPAYESAVYEVFQTLIEAYIYSEKIMDTAYNKAVFKVLIEAYMADDWTPGPDLINILYENSSPGCLARSMMIDFAACGMNFDTGSEWHEHITKFSKDALVDLLKVVSEFGLGEGHKRTDFEIAQGYLDKI